MTTLARLSFQLQRAGFAAGALFLLGAVLRHPASAELHAPTANAPTANVTTISGTALVVDGDTIEINGARLRLEGIDAPETAQTCSTSAGTTWPCGRAASKALTALVANADIACDSLGHDKYNRLLATCFANGIDINAAMVRAGMAWAFVKYSTAYVAEETAAKSAKTGVWQGPAEAPWDFRHQGWQVAEAVAPQGCAIKGNVSGRGRIYHMPWSAWYDRVTVDPGRGERWFCSELDASDAGWRPAETN